MIDGPEDKEETEDDNDTEALKLGGKDPLAKEEAVKEDDTSGD